MKLQIYICCLITSFGLNAQSTFKVTGKALASKQKVSLQFLNPDLLEYEPLTECVTNTDKQFQFEAPFSQANLYRLKFEDGFQVYLSIENPQTITVKRTAAGVELTGSISSSKLLEFEKENKRLQQKHFGALKQAVDQAMAAKDQKRLDSLMAQSQIAIKHFLIEFRQALIEMGTTPAAYHALQFSDFNKELDFLESRLAAFQKEAPEALTTKALSKKIYQAKVTAIGNKPPQIQAKDQNNQAITLAKFEGKILLVDFWAAWCRACRIENPKFVQLYNQYKDQGLEILSISLDKTTQQWQDAIEKDGIGRWRHVWDQEGTIKALYSISSLPQNVVLDRAGVIIGKNVGADQLEALLKRVL